MTTEATTETGGESETPKSPAEQRRILNQFLAECSELRQLEAKLGRFSLFGVLRFEEGEIRHSNVLAWLLDPSESHGLGESFLKRFCILLKAKYPDEPALPDVIEVEAASLSEVEVKREWADRKTRNRLDLLVMLTLDNDEKWVLAVEVKVGSSQGQDQLVTYWNKIQTEHADATRRIYIFLTKDAEEPQEGSGFLGVDFQLVHRALAECMEERGDLVANGPKNLIEEYQRLLETRFMPENEIQKLARKIYREHREAFDIILSNRPDFLQTVSDRVEQELPSIVTKLDFRLYRIIKGWAYLLPNAWNQPRNQKDNGGFYLHCLIDFRGSQVFLRIALAGGDEEFRNKIIGAANSSEFRRGTNRQPGKTWRALHSEKLKVEMKDEEFEDNEEVAKQLIDAIKAALESDAMKKRVEKLSPALA